MTAKPPLMLSLRGVCAGGGVIHAPGVPGAPPLREIPIDEVPAETCAPSDRGEPTRMGKSGLTPGYRIHLNRKWLPEPRRRQQPAKPAPLLWDVVVRAGQAVGARVTVNPRASSCRMWLRALLALSMRSAW